MRLHLLVPLVLVLGACAAPAPEAVQVAAAAPADPNAPRFECHQESDIGSMRMHKVCEKVQTDSERLATQQAILDRLPNASILHPAVGDPTYKKPH